MFIELSRAVHRRNAVFALLFCNLLMSLSLLLVPETLPTDSSATQGVEATPTLTISGSHSLNLTVGPGQFGTSELQDLVVETTNYTGYTMTIAPSTGESTDLVNTMLSTATIPSIVDATTAANFEDLNSAAYGLSIDEGTNYLPVTSGATINTTSGPTDSTTGALTLKLAAKTQADTPAGTYTKSFTVSAVANTPLYSVTFDANAGDDDVTNMPDQNPQTTGVSGINLTLSSAIPQRSGYNFLGWSEDQDAATASYHSMQQSITLSPFMLSGRMCLMY